MGFGAITGTSSAILPTYVRLQDRATLDVPPQTWYNRNYIAAGEQKLSPWVAVRQYKTKTMMVRPRGCTGTFFIVTGMSGTSAGNGTGTYYQSRIGQGSYTLNTFTEQVGYLRAGFRASAVGSFDLSGYFQV